MLPATACYSTVEFYISAENASGATYTDPPAAPFVWRRVFVSESEQTILHEDFEGSNGWRPSTAESSATGGLWDWAVPQATAAQPGHDRTGGTGTKCWVTGAAAGTSSGSFDVDGGRAVLASSKYDLSLYPDAIIGFWLWYSNASGSAPAQDVFEIEISNDGLDWESVEVVGPGGPFNGGGWGYHEFRLADFLPTPGTEVRMRFTASDLGAGSVVEAAIDEFRIFRRTCVPAGFTPGDFDGDGDVTLADFAFFIDCLGGPDKAPAPVLLGVTHSQCLEVFDFDTDEDVDLDDAADMQQFAGG
jgi:hypothetical protein